MNEISEAIYKDHGLSPFGEDNYIWYLQAVFFDVRNKVICDSFIKKHFGNYPCKTEGILTLKRDENGLIIFKKVSIHNKDIPEDWIWGFHDAKKDSQEPGDRTLFYELEKLVEELSNGDLEFRADIYLRVDTNPF